MKTSGKPQREYAGHGRVEPIREPEPFMKPPSLDDLLPKDNRFIHHEMEGMVENTVCGFSNTLRVNSANKPAKQAPNEETSEKVNKRA